MEHFFDETVIGVGLGFAGEDESDFGADAECAVNEEPAAVAVNDAFDDGEAEADADVAGGDERFGDVREIFERDAVAGVLAINAPGAAGGELVVGEVGGGGFGGADVEAAAFEHGLKCVAEDVLEGLGEANPVGVEFDGGGERFFDGDDGHFGAGGGGFLAEDGDLEEAFLGEFVGEVADAGVEEFFEVDVFGDDADGVGEEGEVLDKEVNAVDFVGDDVAELVAEFGFVVAFREELGVNLDGDEGVFEFVGEAGGEAGEEFFVGEFAFVGLLEFGFGEVFEEGDGDEALADAEAGGEAGGADVEGAPGAGEYDFALADFLAGLENFIQSVGDTGRKAVGVAADKVGFAEVEKVAGAVVGGEDSVVLADGDDGALGVGEDFGHESLLAGDFGLEVEVADGLGELGEEVVDEFEFFVGEFLAGDFAAEGEGAEELVVVEHGDGDFGAEEFKFAGDLEVVFGGEWVEDGGAAEDFGFAGKLAADAEVEAEAKMLDDVGGNAVAAGDGEVTFVEDEAVGEEVVVVVAGEEGEFADAEEFADEAEEFGEEGAFDRGL